MGFNSGFKGLNYFLTWLVLVLVLMLVFREWYVFRQHWFKRKFFLVLLSVVTRVTQYAEYSSVSYQETSFTKQCCIFQASFTLPCYECFESVLVTSLIFSHSVETVIKCAVAICNVRLLRYIPYVSFFTTGLTFLWIYASYSTTLS